ncbi:MAG: hypothetical protein LBN93_11395 [Candidatus Symbiothrix sp.]|jgi:hypothetical protein|nr:hypothetical protein [Candidatus Symbiothrix sp.]
MKTLSLDQIENLQGGWKPAGWGASVEQHIICGMIGFGAASCSFGVGAAFGYLGCLALIYSAEEEESNGYYAPEESED